MDQLGIPRYFVTTGALAMMGFAIFYLISAWLFLQFIPVRMSFSKQVKSSEREEGTAEAVARLKSAEVRPQEVTIRVQDLKLWIKKRAFQKRLDVHILQGVTVDFKPGRLNVIMGPSGFSLKHQL
jgi:hypothetical protein